MSYFTIESKDFFKIQEKELCSEFKDPQTNTACVVSASNLSHNLMRSAGLFGDLKKGVKVRLGELPLKISKESFDRDLSIARKNCQVWGRPPGASKEEKKKAELMTSACLVGVERFKTELNL